MHNYEGKQCKECAKAWEFANKERLAAQNKAYILAHHAHLLEKRRATRKAKKDHYSAYGKAYRQANKARRCAQQMKRQAAQLKRTPKWLTKEQYKEIEQFYIDAEYLTQYTKVKFEVDHIIPLQGKNISGLHVPGNLQILTEAENMSKGNKFNVKN